MALGRDFRLPRDVRPLRYELRFDLDLDHWTFEGVETIRIVLAGREHPPVAVAAGGATAWIPERIRLAVARTTRT